MFPVVFRETIACVQYVIRLFMDVRSLVFLRVEHCLSGLPVIVISEAFVLNICIAKKGNVF